MTTREVSSQKFTIVVVAFGLAFLKLLFSQLYRSTDFEVHRNWLAVTHSTPLNKWYYENTSQWTLDYPPYFAYFEWALSQLAVRIDPAMVSVNMLNYASRATVMFQRVSVIASDVLLVIACLVLATEAANGNRTGAAKAKAASILSTCLLLLCNFGLLIVDHIHFQYNGMLTGILIASLLCIAKHGADSKSTSLCGAVYIGAFLFAALLNFKHIYLYTAPAVFVHLFRHFCICNRSAGQISIPLPFLGGGRLCLARLAKLGCIVVAVFATSLGPFLYHSQLGQLALRLFPFKRGLCHAYWAPNFWSLYNCVDKALELLGIRLGLVAKQPGVGVMTGGLVEEFTHAVLPTVMPWHTFALTGICLMPILLRAWSAPKDRPLRLVCLDSAALCAWTAYAFGWHVHEKAILLVIPILIVTMFESEFHCRLALATLPVGHFSLFPLLFTSYECWIKYWLFASYTLATAYAAGEAFPGLSTRDLLPPCVLGLAPLWLVTDILLPTLTPGLPFLPLMLTSFYCAVCLAWAYTTYLAYFLRGHADGTRVSGKGKKAN